MKRIPHKPLTDEWFEYRRKRITSTDVPALFGASTFKTPLSIYMRVTGQSVDERDDNDVMRWGRFMEESCRKWTEAEAGITIRANEDIWQHDEIPYLCATPDGTVFSGETEAGTWEGKCPSPWKKKDWIDQMPKAYQIQVLTTLAISGHERGWLSALFQPELRYGIVQRQADLIKKIEDKVTEFWDKHVAAEVPPRASDRDDRLLKDLHPEDSGETITFDSHELVSATERLLHLQAREKMRKKEIDALRNEIRQTMGPASYAVLPSGGAWSYVRNARGTRVLTYVQRVPNVK